MEYAPLGPAVPLPTSIKMGVLYEQPDGSVGWYGDLGMWYPLNKEKAIMDWEHYEGPPHVVSPNRIPPRDLDSGAAVEPPYEIPSEEELELSLAGCEREV